MAALWFGRQGHAQFGQVNSPEVVAYHSQLADVAPRTRLRRLAALRSLNRWMIRTGRRAQWDWPDLRFGRPLRHLPKALPATELTQLLENTDLDSPRNLRDRAFLELLYGTGLRVSEAVSLRTDAVLTGDQALRVTGKRGKTRIVPVPTETWSWLETYVREARPQLASKPLAALWLNDRGGPLSRQSADRIVRQRARRAGLGRGISAHTLRHTYGAHPAPHLRGSFAGRRRGPPGGAGATRPRQPRHHPDLPNLTCGKRKTNTARRTPALSKPASLRSASHRGRGHPPSPAPTEKSPQSQSSPRYPCSGQTAA